jgi:ABC-type transporter Mla subunit MlaD
MADFSALSTAITNLIAAADANATRVAAKLAALQAAVDAAKTEQPTIDTFVTQIQPIIDSLNATAV